MVKFGGDLVGRGLVPAEGVMTWIHTLLSEKTEQDFSDAWSRIWLHPKVKLNEKYIMKNTLKCRC